MIMIIPRFLHHLTFDLGHANAKLPTPNPLPLPLLLLLLALGPAWAGNDSSCCTPSPFLSVLTAVSWTTIHILWHDYAKEAITLTGEMASA